MQVSSWFYPGPFSLLTAHCLLTQASLWLWPYCHNKQITLFSEFPTPSLCLQVTTGLSSLGISLVFRNQHARTENLFPKPPPTLHFSLSHPHPPTCFTWIPGVHPLLYLLYPINHSVLLIPSSKDIVNGFVSPSALLIPCTSHHALSPGYSNNLLIGLSPFSLLWNVDILFFKSQNQGFLRSVLI